ncbi:MAG: molecular chaperone [Ralstonia sp.]|jgi:TorA maturation chaperone TorD|uniref:Chaperone protein TorD n=4 Tax=Pseudomonadota TaxID=1224 RepID=A0A2P4RMI3_RALPI|nr:MULTISPECIES: molecular chaperone [Ralstonia]MEA3271652.1 molecular chaperone [Pseudomonadota bacterium]ENZ77049.1 Tat proofreading chaperone TorD [Ralstonia pickettii OR214]KFL20908.1 nitrate reductase delta subunit [Ralstonia pickettii]MBA4015509.1 molecular chaperone [Ralstonia sp.]MBA4199390.1 molecular chaperone [Ralstonia sp.]
MTDAQPLQFQPAATPADSAEDLARADLYGLLATLFFHAADADLLQRIAAAPLDPIGDGDIAAADAQAAASSALTQAWRKLVARAGQTTAEQADDEYTELFIGVGKPEVFLYGSYYQAGFMNEKPLVVLRDDLRRHGLERAEGITETEDHLATLCEVMRYLIAGDDVAVARIEEQRAFFQRHLAPWVDTACDAVLQHPRAALYADVAGLAKAFFDVERLALELA